MFSTFPDGWPGAGLLLLRAASGILLTVQGVAYILDWPDVRLLVCVLAVLATGSGVLLLLGCVTRAAALVATVACGSGILSWLPLPGPNLFAGKLPSALVAVIAVSVICLGPGAFSLDARLFGRREVLIPKKTHDYGD